MATISTCAVMLITVQGVARGTGTEVATVNVGTGELTSTIFNQTLIDVCIRNQIYEMHKDLFPKHASYQSS